MRVRIKCYEGENRQGRRMMCIDGGLEGVGRGRRKMEWRGEDNRVE